MLTTLSRYQKCVDKLEAAKAVDNDFHYPAVTASSPPPPPQSFLPPLIPSDLVPPSFGSPLSLYFLLPFPLWLLLQLQVIMGSAFLLAYLGLKGWPFEVLL